MDLPRNLIDEIRHGNVALFLGSGASIGAVDDKGRAPPLADELRDRISDKFLESDFKERPLPVVGELAESQTDLFTFQEFVASQFEKIKPAVFHHLLAGFRWRALITTNYDRLVEDAYKGAKDPIQSLVPAYSNEDQLDKMLRAADQVALLKLHGCITLTRREDLPLILTPDQYATHRENRDLLFARFADIAREYTVVFVGHSLQDHDVRAVLVDLNKRLKSRPTYYFVSPGTTEVEKRFWAQRKVQVLPGSFEEFLTALDAELPRPLRPLLRKIDPEHPVRRLFLEDVPVPENVLELLASHAELVHAGQEYEKGNPERFFRGFDFAWYPVREGLDVRRRLVDTLLSDVIIRPETDRPSKTDFYAVKAEAGSGKSILLRRVAWEAATEADSLVLFTRPFGDPRIEDIAHLCRLTGRRVFLFFDQAAVHVSQLVEIIEGARKEDIPLTILTSERVNEWNMSCESLDPFLSDSFPLHYLSESEIEDLVRLLEKHRCLGPGLEKKTFEERCLQFKEKAGRQLLVALHEATTGVRFEEILENEYDAIHPTRAQQLYLTVCVLNRLRVPVRAGLISRVHEIPFEDFRKELFAPLEKVIYVQEWESTGDYYYAARHPEIAQIVFTRILSKTEDRFNEYVRLIGNLNLAYSTDRESFRGLLRAKALHELFPDYKDVKAIFQKAEEVGPKEAYLFQQRANYERIRPDGNLRDAEQYLETALELDPRDLSVPHTLAELYRTKAEKAERSLEKEKHRQAARAILGDLKRRDRSRSYPKVTLVKLGIDEVRDLLYSPDATDREIDEAIRNVEKTLERSLQEHPDEQFLLSAEADFSALVADHERSFKALQRAVRANPRDPYLAGRFAKALERKSELTEAAEVLEEALKSNRGDMRLNYRYADLLRRTGQRDPDTLAALFERAFTEGDRNYEAQFWFARFAFESAEPARRDRAYGVFKNLSKAWVSHAQKVEVRDVISDHRGPIHFRGTVERLEESYGRIRRDGPGDLIFVHMDNVPEGTWSKMRRGERVAFQVGFCYRGPKAVEVELI